MLWGLAAVHVAHALRLRERRAVIPSLPAPGTPASPRAGSTVTGDELVVLAARGVEVDATTRVAVAQEMTATGARVVDLLPGDLPADRTLLVLGRIEVERLGTDALYAPGGVHEALVLHPAVAERMGLAAAAGETLMLDRGELMRRTADAQRYAPGAAILRLAPDLRAGPAAADDRWEELEELSAFARPQVALAPAALAGDLGHLVGMTAGLALAPVPALAAMLTWSAHPAVVLDRRSPGETLLRVPRAWARHLGTAAAATRRMRAAAAQRAESPPPAPPPAGELFEEPRTTCPWCGAGDLVGILDTADLLQHKPGEFHLDRCARCGHVFQNPALSIAGLDFYYEEFYDGASGEMAESAFAGNAELYRRRAEAVARFTEPRAWLDVGAGHGHFCLAARQLWPDATFDGLDLSEGIDEAGRRGWVDTAYRGLFPELAGGLPRSYDVVSMCHYLEHTRDPREELAAAAKVLEPGGHLLVEMPDPESPWARRLGRYWSGWFQPQHQHMPPCRNLEAALDEAGFTVLSVERGPATTGFDLCLGLFIALGGWAPSPQLPWAPRPTARDRVKRLAALGAALPAFGLLAVADRVKDERDRRPGNSDPSSAYRIVARRQ